MFCDCCRFWIVCDNWGSYLLIAFFKFYYSMSQCFWGIETGRWYMHILLWVACKFWSICTYFVQGHTTSSTLEDEQTRYMHICARCIEQNLNVHVKTATLRARTGTASNVRTFLLSPHDFRPFFKLPMVWSLIKHLITNWIFSFTSKVSGISKTVEFERKISVVKFKDLTSRALFTSYMLATYF